VGRADWHLAGNAGDVGRLIKGVDAVTAGVAKSSAIYPARCGYSAMFDYYEPVPVLTCPKCGAELREWQGKDGPCALFVWRQHEPNPVGQRAYDNNIAAEERAKLGYRDASRSGRAAAVETSSSMQSVRHQQAFG
jgi:hypothetical protein